MEPQDTSADNDDPDGARYRLQAMTASDPTVIANMTRHALALKILTTGARDERANDQAPGFVASFTMTRGECETIMAAAGRLGVAQVVQCFDIDDAAGAPRGLGVFRAEGDSIVVYPRCLPWSPPGGGRAVLVPHGAGAPVCHLVARPGRPLARIEGWPAEDLGPGVRRAEARLARLVRSPELRDAHVGAYLHTVQPTGGKFQVEILRIGD